MADFLKVRFIFFFRLFALFAKNLKMFVCLLRILEYLSETIIDMLQSCITTKLFVDCPG